MTHRSVVVWLIHVFLDILLKPMLASSAILLYSQRCCHPAAYVHGALHSHNVVVKYAYILYSACKSICAIRFQSFALSGPLAWCYPSVLLVHIHCMTGVAIGPAID